MEESDNLSVPRGDGGVNDDNLSVPTEVQARPVIASSMTLPTPASRNSLSVKPGQLRESFAAARAISSGA